MTHFGDRLTALVDGELGHEERDLILAHLAGCADCRAAVDQQRRLKSALAAAVGPGPSDGLLSRLVAMAEPGEPTPPERRWFPPGGSVSQAPSAPWAQRRGPITMSHRAERVAHLARRRVYAAATGALTITAMAAGLAVAGGTEQQPGPALTPPVDTYTRQHAQITGQITGDPAYTAVVGGITPTGVARR